MNDWSLNKKKIMWTAVAVLLLVPAVLDAVRYLGPEATNKQAVLPRSSFPVASATGLILAYNAWGGWYPGLADVVHKEFFPASYPCNLCYQAFGTFGMRAEWKNFLDSLPLTVKKVYKDEFQRQFKPEKLQLPAILVYNSSETQVLLSAAQIDQYRSPESLLQALRNALQNQ